MWSYNLVLKGPHPYLSSFVQTNIAPLWIIRPDQNGPRTRVLLVCVCSGTTGLTKGELLGVRLREGGGGGDSGFQVTRKCEWGLKLKAKKIPWT